MRSESKKFQAEIRRTLRELFGFETVSGIELVYQHYRCVNYKITVEGRARFFLKRYAGRTGDEVFQTKIAERFFASRDIPVLLPLLDKHGRPAFFLDNDWFSLFPFVDAPTPNIPLDKRYIENMGMLLGQIHAIGKGYTDPSFRRLSLWDKDEFRFRIVELKQRLSETQLEPELEDLVQKTLERKEDFVNHDERLAKDVHLPFDTLLHGDPIFQNTFINNHQEVEKIFDLEDACVGSSAYEFSRALLINCFEYGVDDNGLELAKIFLRAYQSKHEISQEQLHAGVEAYVVKSAHKLWFETKILFGAFPESMKQSYKAHAKRIQLANSNLAEFCAKIYH